MRMFTKIRAQTSSPGRSLLIQARRPHATASRRAHQQADFLRQSAAAFDIGRFAENKRLAVAVRILCHDTGRSHSLLGQVGLLDSLPFVDATPRRSEHDDLAEEDDGVVYVTILSSPLAPISGGPLGFRPVTSLDSAASRPKPFAEWWDATIVETSQVSMSRRDVVLALANWDGGAHVDESGASATYVAISQERALGTITYLTEAGKTVVVDINPTLVIMRSIAFEVLATLDPVIGAPTT